MLPLRARPTRALLGLAALALGCSVSGGTAGPTTPTLIAVSPQDFAGDVPCADAPGAMRSYVVTLYDLGSAEEPQEPFALPSSVVRQGDGSFAPARCESATAFSFVIPGHRYDAEIEVYDRADLRALGAGSRHLVDASGAYVPPRWTTTCGRKQGGSAAEGPVTAAWYLTRFVRGCEPLATTQPATPTGIRVSLDDALGKLACGEAGGQVALFTAKRDDSEEPSQGAACGESVQFVGLEAGTTYSFTVQAFESGALTPRWGTTCYRKALAGAVVPAACDALVELEP